MSFPSAMPAPRLPDPMAAPPLRWGVIGTGWIAERFAGSLAATPDSGWSRSGPARWPRPRTSRIASAIGRAHGSYADLVADPEVDVVYVATPHNFHHPHALLALDAGKHVLVEKPLALNAAQASEIAARASARGVFCAEAMWTFFLPRYDVIRQLLDDGVLGDVRTVLADHGEWFPDTHRILRHDLAGGALLDLGTYPLALASWVLGAPEEVHAIGQDVPGGEVHGQVSTLLQHDGGAQSVINTTVMADTPNGAVLAGTGATLVLEPPFYQPGDLVLTTAGKGSTLRWTEPAIGHEALYVTAVEAGPADRGGRHHHPAPPARRLRRDPRAGGRHPPPDRRHVRRGNRTGGARMTVPTIPLNTGGSLPQIGLGTARVTDQDEARRIVLEALEVGYRHVRTRPQSTTTRSGSDAGSPNPDYRGTTCSSPRSCAAPSRARTPGRRCGRALIGSGSITSISTSSTGHSPGSTASSSRWKIMEELRDRGPDEGYRGVELPARAPRPAGGGVVDCACRQPDRAAPAGAAAGPARRRRPSRHRRQSRGRRWRRATSWRNRCLPTSGGSMGSRRRRWCCAGTCSRASWQSQRPRTSTGFAQTWTCSTSR